MTALFHALFRLLLCSDAKNDHIAVLEHAKLFHSLIEIAVVCCLSILTIGAWPSRHSDCRQSRRSPSGRSR